MSEENPNSESSQTKGQVESTTTARADSIATEVIVTSPSSTPVKNSQVTELSLEEIEAEINKEDPLFSSSLEDIKAVKTSDDIQIETYDSESELNTYFQQQRESRGFRKWLFRIFPFLPKLRKQVGTLWFRFKAAFVHLLTVLVPRFFILLKDVLFFGFKQLASLAQIFKKKSTGQKIGFIIFMLFAGASSFFTWYLWVKKPLDHTTELFVTSMEEFADYAYRYDPKTELEPFYNNYRVSQNIITIPRMIMNIKASENSGSNPMAAIELYVEGGSPEVVVEIKDREAEMKDVMQRAVEEMNFDELIVPEGKQALSDRLRREVNRVLTKGKVRRIFLKSAVFKP